MRNFVKVILFFLGALFVACSGPQEETTPPDILPQDKVADVLVSLNLSESITNFYNSNGNANKKDFQFNAFAENNVKREDYYKSINYYSHHPQKMKEIYEQVMEKLNLLKNEK